MDEENKTTNGGAENIENNAAQTETEQPKETLFTQEQLNDILDERLKRERRRTDKIYSGHEQLKEMYNTLKENGVIKTDDLAAAVSDIKQFYAKGDGESVGEPKAAEPKKAVAVLPEDQKQALVEYSTTKWAEKASAEDIEDEYQTLKEKGKRRTDEEDIKFGVISKKCAEINAKKTSQRQIDEFKSRYPKVNLEDLKKDDEFREFTRLSRVSLLETYEAYQKLKGNRPLEKKSTGSVAAESGKPETALFSQDELKKLKPEDLDKNEDLVRKSIIENIRKSMKT